ncbi:cation transporter 15-like [Octopus vulgaris]|uniref:Cation transporter 15-like n=2 Tax=Octopus vulgaris TaxID=6645 RepID=A0AA36FBT3_OCTVU|nr:cation transporter 15-like [Octopus vulgaris]
MENEASVLNELHEELNVEEFKDLSVSEITEEILKKCGTYGLFQKKLTIYILIFVIFHAPAVLTIVFIRESVPFACYPSNFNESLIPLNITLDEFLNKAAVEDEKCSVYNLDTKEGFYILPTSNSTKEPCNIGRKFYSDHLSSIVSEFDLACEREWLKNIAVSAMFAGFLVGNILFGTLSDAFGRFKMFCAANALSIFSGLIKIYSPNIIVFLIIYIIEGFGIAGTYLILFTILQECVTQNYRTRLNYLMHGTYGLGAMLLAGVAYVFPKWQHLLYATIIPHILIFILALKFLPESPRWLLNKGKFTEAEKSFEKIAKTNKKNAEIAVKLIQKLQTERKSKLQAEVDENMKLGSKKIHKTYTAIDLLKKPRRAMISVNIWFNWLVNSMIYFGVTLNSVDMSGNRYINFLVMSAVEIPANILGCITFKWFGHRKPLCFFMVFGGINCIVSNFVPKGNFWFPLILAVLGKLGATASYDGVYLTTAEIFPTAVRNGGIGAASSFARFGGIISAPILGLSVYGSWIPLSIFGVFGIVAGLLVLLLPETKDACLLQTLEDMDNL